MVPEHPGEAYARFAGMAIPWLFPSMLPVHSDLFLYVMRERNNRLFSQEKQS
jgi:hypothetical protein